MLVNNHPVYHRPFLHCGKCQMPLTFPRKAETDEADVRAGKAVLAECITCAVGVMIPAEMLIPTVHTRVSTCTVTHKMRMGELDEPQDARQAQQRSSSPKA